MFEDDLNPLPDPQRRVLHAVVTHVAGIVPQATEGRSYGLPAFRYQGKPLLGFAAAKDHLSLYPFSPAVIEAVKGQLDGYVLSKGTIRFTADRPVPVGVLTEIVQRRMREIDGS